MSLNQCSNFCDQTSSIIKDQNKWLTPLLSLSRYQKISMSPDGEILVSAGSTSNIYDRIKQSVGRTLEYYWNGHETDPKKICQYLEDKFFEIQSNLPELPSDLEVNNLEEAQALKKFFIEMTELNKTINMVAASILNLSMTYSDESENYVNLSGWRGKDYKGVCDSLRTLSERSSRVARSCDDTASIVGRALRKFKLKDPTRIEQVNQLRRIGLPPQDESKSNISERLRSILFDLDNIMNKIEKSTQTTS